MVDEVIQIIINTSIYNKLFIITYYVYLIFCFEKRSIFAIMAQLKLSIALIEISSKQSFD